MSGREATNVRPRGHECPAERPRMSGAEAKDVQSNDRERPLEWRTRAHHARPDPLAGVCTSCPLGPTYVPSRPDICARSARHMCPLDPTSVPARPDIRARSTRHMCPLDPTYVPARGDIRARSRGRRGRSGGLPDVDGCDVGGLPVAPVDHANPVGTAMRQLDEALEPPGAGGHGRQGERDPSTLPA
jgi:hypothetical protein